MKRRCNARPFAQGLRWHPEICTSIIILKVSLEGTDSNWAYLKSHQRQNILLNYSEYSVNAIFSSSGFVSFFNLLSIKRTTYITSVFATQWHITANMRLQGRNLQIPSFKIPSHIKELQAQLCTFVDELRADSALCWMLFCSLFLFPTEFI